jgi:hypothetical protein
MTDTRRPIARPTDRVDGSGTTDRRRRRCAARRAHDPATTDNIVHSGLVTTVFAWVHFMKEGFRLASVAYVRCLDRHVERRFACSRFQ